MVNIRCATTEDLISIQDINTWCLPESYRFDYILNHFMRWPNLCLVAEDFDGKIVGYVIGKICETVIPIAGHIVSIAVRQSYRLCGIATQLLRIVHCAMLECYGARSCSLHVRCDNKVAQHLYAAVLGYRIEYRKYSYYGWRSDAYYMKRRMGPPLIETMCCTCT